MKPLLTYVLPTKDREEWVGEAIGSILAQSFSDIELIVINDGSKDGTKEFLEDWLKDEPRVRLIHHETSLGAGYSRNEGTKLAVADLVAQMDDDDMCVFERTAMTLKWFKDHPSSDLVNFPYVRVDGLNKPMENFAGNPFDKKLFLETGGVNYFSNPTCAYRKKAFLETKGYGGEDKDSTDDYKFVKNWLEAGKEIDFCAGAPAVLHRVLQNSMMAQFRGFKEEWARA